MLKYFHLRVAFLAASMLFIAETASSNPPIGSESPMITGLNTDNLVCYMQTADGRTVNLDSLCINQPQIVASAFRYNDDHIIISVINKTETNVNFIKVDYEVIGQDSSVIQSKATYTAQHTLSPGQMARFLAFVPGLPGGSNVRITSVEWN